MRAFSEFVMFLDTLTGRMWTCRHAKGILDVWKCMDMPAPGGR
jgi:hypothetical protein